MKISTGIRHLREGGRSIIRNGWMTFASIGSIAISLFILGLFFLLTMNVNYISRQIENQVEIQVFLDVNLPKGDIQHLQNDIGMMPEVKKVTFVSKEEGMAFLKEKLGKDGQDLLDEFTGDNNPLPDSFKVEVKTPQLVGTVADQIQALNNGKDPAPITKITYGKGTVETLFKITNLVRNVGLIIVIGLVFTSMFLISNTIKLTILSRRREIAIMKLVGATNGFIRWPFFIEGALIGLVGSLVPVIILVIGYQKLYQISSASLGQMLIRMVPIQDVGMKMAGLLLVLGIVLGVWGTTISVRKFLKV